MGKKVAVILAGCGYLDGAEVTEAVASLIALDQAGAAVQCFALNEEQMHVVDHIAGEEVAGQKRNVMVESARICRGDIKPLSEYAAADFDALLMPGGFGVAKNNCDFAVKGGDMAVHEQVADAITSTYSAGKPIAALCIAPVLLAKLIAGAKVTVGSNADVIGAITGAFGAVHEETTHGQVVVDGAHKLVTTPCYMLEASPAQIYTGAKNCVDALLQMA